MWNEWKKVILEIWGNVIVYVGTKNDTHVVKGLIPKYTGD